MVLNYLFDLIAPLTNLSFTDLLFGVVLIFITEFSFFITPLGKLTYFPFVLHFSLAVVITILFFSTDDNTFASLIFAAIIYIFVFFRIFALFIVDTQSTQMMLSSLFYPQNSTILTPLALDFLQQQAQRVMAAPDGTKPTPSSAYNSNKGLNDDMIAGGFGKINGKDNDKEPVRYGLATVSDIPPKIPVLMIIAHPDDESMFFTPVLHAMAQHNELVYQGFPHLRKSGTNNNASNGNNNDKPSLEFQKVTPALYDIHILCLTTGNAAGLGKIRSEELINTCVNIHNIDRGNIEIISDDIRLPDSMTAPWDQNVVVEYISNYIQRKNLHMIDFTPAKNKNDKKTTMVMGNIPKKEELPALHHINFHDLILLTFDEDGVSSHKNHIACYNAVRQYTSQYNSRLLLEQGNLQHQSDLRNELGMDNDNNPHYISSSDDDRDSSDESDGLDEDGQLLKQRRRHRGGKTFQANVNIDDDATKNKRKKKSSINRHLAYRINQGPITKRYITVYGIETIPLWSKYLGPYSAMMVITGQLSTSNTNPHTQSLLLQNKIIVPNTNTLQSWNAMAMHYSQWVWFRKLFVLFSTYTYVTPLVMLQASPIHPSIKHVGKSIQSGLVMD